MLNFASKLGNFGNENSIKHLHRESDQPSLSFQLSTLEKEEFGLMTKLISSFALQTRNLGK